MKLAALLLFIGIIPLWVLLAARYLDAKAWRQSLVALQVQLSAHTTIGDVERWLARVQVMTESPQWFLLPNTPLALEVRAERGRIEHVVLAPKRLKQAVVTSLQAAMPGVRIEELPGDLRGRPSFRLATEATLTSQVRPLAVERAAETSQHLLTALQPLNQGERIVLQYIFSGISRRPLRRTPSSDVLPWWLNDDAAMQADDLRAERIKHKSPLMQASIRVGIQASSRPRALRLLHRVWPALGGMDASGVRLLKRWHVSMRSAAKRLADVRQPLTSWPVVVNVEEAAGLTAVASSGLRVLGLPSGVARTLAAPPSFPRRGLEVATSNYMGDTRPLSLMRSDRLRHLHLLGPTGSGKSTLLQNLIQQDLQQGDGLVVLDARGDLVYDVLDQIPPERYDDVVVLDPSNTAQVVGFNPLAVGSTIHERELAAEHILSVLKSVFQTSWGVRTADVLRASLLTLTATNAVDGNRQTLCELPELLTNDHFRRFVTSQPLPPVLRSFWRWYDNLSPSERSTIIAPSLNKLRQFLLATPLRLTLGQSNGINVADAYTKRKVILVPLKRALIGSETTALLGSLILAGIWNATLLRAKTPPERRRPYWLYADEFQEFMRLPLDLADMVAQARGLGLGLTLAHQYLGQLSPDLKAGIQGSIKSQVVFQVEHDDARALAPRFAPLTAEDLQGLGSHEVAFRASIRGHTHSPVTGVTAPPVPSTGSRHEVLRRSAHNYAVGVDDIEAALQARIAVDPKQRTNRRPKGGQA